MDAQTVLAIIGLLERDAIAVWIDGGWGVDALVGRELREHDDLDLVAELRHSKRIVELLNGLGYELVDGRPPQSFVLVDASGRQVDIHPVAFDVAGGGVYEMRDGNTWTYAGQGFTGRGTLAGRPVRCLSPQVQLLVHAGYELTDKDYEELRILREELGA